MTTTDSDASGKDPKVKQNGSSETSGETKADALLQASEETVNVVDDATESADEPGQEELLVEVETLRSRLEELEDMKDGFLRAKAEMENIRRRSQNEIVSVRKFAIEGFAQELLNVRDSMDQASMVELREEESEAVVKMKEGLELTVKQLDSVLIKFGVSEVEADIGVKFDPELHQAISMVESAEVDSNHIIAVMQKGFMLKGRLLRPAMVVVAS
jgi:molecular chaperone GrpE